MRFWICDISSPDAESRSEMDFEEPPAEGSVIAPGRMVYKITAVVRLPSEMSSGVIEVERLTEPEPISAMAGQWYGPGPY
jgi:hypothetical protein